MNDALLIEQRDRILVATLNRPEHRNAINSDIGMGLLDFVRTLDDDPGLVVGVLTGAGSGFCSGMDLKAFAKEGAPKGLSRFYVQGASKPLVCVIRCSTVTSALPLAANSGQ